MWHPESLGFFKELLMIAQKAMEPHVHVALGSCSCHQLVVSAKQGNCLLDWS